MLKITYFILAVLLSLNVSAQVRALTQASATIVEPVGASISDSDFGDRALLNINAGIEISKSVSNDVTIGKDQKVELGSIGLIGSSFAYAITLPATEITLIRQGGTETLIIKPSYSTGSAYTDTNADFQSISLKADCELNASTVAGRYHSDTDLNILVNYN